MCHVQQNMYVRFIHNLPVYSVHILYLIVSVKTANIKSLEIEVP